MGGVSASADRNQKKIAVKEEGQQDSRPCRGENDKGSVLGTVLCP